MSAVGVGGVTPLAQPLFPDHLDAYTIDFLLSDVPPSTQTFTAGGNVQLDVSARLEADADHDGFGDETQDECPTNGTTQGPCPVTPVKKKKCKKHKSAAAIAKKCKKKHY